MTASRHAQSVEANTLDQQLRVKQPTESEAKTSPAAEPGTAGYMTVR